jgi:5-methylcytosine-specific restriction endonuclease McrA
MDRKKYTPNEYTILYNEVDGLCPLCGIKLIYEKGNKLNKRVNLAHIYPHSPTDSEKKLLKDVEKLSEDREDLKNIIWLCPNCHENFDKPRTIDGYNNLLNIKKRILQEKDIKDTFHDYNIEDDIKKILNKLTNDDIATDIELKYDPKIIDRKLNNTILSITKRTIKSNVSEYFHIIRHELQNLDAITPNKATKIATQIKSFYLETSEKTEIQETIYNGLIEWLHSKTNINKDASAVVISYFVQNCEVF